eukprot:jgi/Chlat1/3484/Chrsp23S03685
MASSLLAALAPSVLLTARPGRSGRRQGSRLSVRVSAAAAGNAELERGVAVVLDEPTCSRRSAVLSAAAAAVAAAALPLSVPLPALATAGPVGEYLTKSGVGDLVVYEPDVRSTPAMRAGIVKPYRIYIPPSWKPARVANIQSGNYCQPKCAEPWVEAKYEDDKQGQLQVIVAPLVRLTNRPEAQIEEIAPPALMIERLGQFVTGNSFDIDDLVASHVKDVQNHKYYMYELYTPYALTGAHNLASITSTGNVVVMLTVSASEKQWAKYKSMLNDVVESFKV